MDVKKTSNQTPKTLYNLSVCSLTTTMSREKCFKEEYRDLPNSVLFDLYYKMYTEKRLCLLNGELCQIQIFCRLLKLPDRRVELMQIFQSLRDHTKGTVTADLLATYQFQCSNVEPDDPELESVVDIGLLLGGFLSDSGWYAYSAKVFQEVEDLCKTATHFPYIAYKLLECYHRLLHVQAIYSDFPSAERTLDTALVLIRQLEKEGRCPNIAGFYTECSVFFFMRSEYNKAYMWSYKALESMSPSLPPGIVIDILRQSSKACVVKRQFRKAGLLIQQAVFYAHEIYREVHPKVSDVLMDYGFYLLNYDSILNSVRIYKNALDIRKQIFDKKNLKVAVGHEDLAYALYVNEYSSGRFCKARENAERAINIMESLVPSNHLMLASAKRVQALILEEIALDLPGRNTNDPHDSKSEYLKQSEDLHLAALKLSVSAFGVKNVQTAKHYGNLGRLYQSMMQFEKAEKMHLKAIAIKEELLGGEDYEVGLSIGHLASLYNYHMDKHREAETLYHRSIAISLKLFGESYSGLEYDYRGLVHVYSKLNDLDRMIDYTTTLSNWLYLRDELIQDDDVPLQRNQPPDPIEIIKQNFFSMS